MAKIKTEKNNLDIKVVKTKQSSYELTVTIPFSEIETDLARTRKTIAQSIDAPGFRQGKVPLKMVDSQVGKEAVYDQFYQSVITRYASEAIKQAKVDPISYPRVDIASFEEGDPLVMTVVVPVKPDVKLGKYKGVPVWRPKIEIKESEIDGRLELLRKKHAKPSDKISPIEEGDMVWIDTSLTVDGRLKKDAGKKGWLVQMKIDSPEGYVAEALIGAKVGESREILDEETKDDGSTSKQVYKLMVKKVNQLGLPEVNDEFLADLKNEYADCDSVADLRAKIKDVLIAENEGTINVYLEETLLKQILRDAVIALPPGLVDANIAATLSELAEKSDKMGKTMEEYLYDSGQDQKEFEQRMRDQTESELYIDFALEAIAEKEGLGPSDKELADSIKLNESLFSGSMVDFIKKPKDLIEDLKKRDKRALDHLERKICHQKARDFIVKHAKLENEDKPARGKNKTTKQTKKK